MIFNALTAAAMLLGGFSMPASVLRMNVEQPTPIVWSLMANEQQLTTETRRILIEEHAAPHWNLTLSVAWGLYADGILKLHELEPEVHYLIEYEGILDVNLTEGD